MNQPPELPPYNPYGAPPPAPTPTQGYNPYAAPAAPLEYQNQQVLHLASRWARLGAAFLDGLIYAIPIGIVFGIFASTMASTNEPPVAMFVVMGLVLLVILAVNCMYLHQYGQTIAKRMLGIKVIQTDGNRCELWRFFFLRYLPMALVGSIPGVGPLLSIVNVLLIFGHEQRCLHDLIANTIVVQA
jgi:uncharacterized RDD family membrane protein YckC